jgi:hypothetical protein
MKEIEEDVRFMWCEDQYTVVGFENGRSQEPRNVGTPRFFKTKEMDSSLSCWHLNSSVRAVSDF